MTRFDKWRNRYRQYGAISYSVGQYGKGWEGKKMQDTAKHSTEQSAVHQKDSDCAGHIDAVTGLCAVCGVLPVAESDRMTAVRVAFEEADRLWSEELRVVYGNKAGDARYNGRLNSATPRLAELHTARESARVAWETAKIADQFKR